MRLTHLALNVRDPAASARFYLDVIGLKGSAKTEEWGERLRLDDGFMLALIAGPPLPGDVVDRVHFGVHLGSAEDVHEARARFLTEGLREVEWWEEEGYTSVKVADPDGYVVEVSWDVQ